MAFRICIKCISLIRTKYILDIFFQNDSETKMTKFPINKFVPYGANVSSLKIKGLLTLGIINIKIQHSEANNPFQCRCGL